MAGLLQAGGANPSWWKSPSGLWFALVRLCKVELAITFARCSFEQAFQTLPQECQEQTRSQDPNSNGERPSLHSRTVPLSPACILQLVQRLLQLAARTSEDFSSIPRVQVPICILPYYLFMPKYGSRSSPSGNPPSNLRHVVATARSLSRHSEKCLSS